MRLFLVAFFFILPSLSFALSGRQWWIPQTRTLKPRQMSFDLQARAPLFKDSTTRGIYSSAWGFNFGLVDYSDFGFEAGVDWTEPSRESVNSALSLNARLSFQRVEKQGWAVAAGIDEYGLEPDYNSFQIVYALFQNRLGEEWEMLLGGYIGSGATLGYGGREANGLLAGLWYLVQGGFGSLGAELMSGRNAFGYLVPGARIEVRDGVFVSLAYALANDRPRYKDFLQVRTSIEF